MAEPLLYEEPSPFIDDVAASVIVEPPVVAASTAPPAAIVVGGSASRTGTTAAGVKFADLTESGSESGEEAGASGNTASTSRSSPPPNCAICLSRCKRKCFTDSCMHQFCFKCLCEWSKIKAECPLCKQPFKTIIHNGIDRYTVRTTSTPPMPDHPSLRFHIVNIRRPRYVPLVQNQAVMTSANDIDGAGEGSQDGIPTVEPARILPPANRFEPYRMELMNFYRHDQEVGSILSLSQLWRRYVYDRKLYALPVSDSLTGHFREWSARFYRDNPAQMHRLMPWINRDIVCLLRNSTHSVTEVMQLMNDILPMTNILGPTFRRRLSPFLGDRTSHFIHELFNFARSPYDMVGYDRVVQYSMRVAEEVEVDLDVDVASPLSSNEDEGPAGENAGDWPAVLPERRTPRPPTSVIVTNPSAHSFSVTMATDGSELPGISIRRTMTSNAGSQTVAINLSMRRPADEIIEIDDGDAAANAEVAAINDNSNGSHNRRNAGASLPVSAHIELQSSDSACSNSSDDEDECVFVLERKPPHLRTPELVSLDSGSDSDVVFVDEQRPTKPPEPVEEASNAEPEASSANELFMGPSTSTGVCSTAGKNWKKVLEEARRQDRIRVTRHKKDTRRNLSYFAQRCFENGKGGGDGSTLKPSSSESSSSDSSSLSTSSSSSSSDTESDSEEEKQLKKRSTRRVPLRKRPVRTAKAQKPRMKRKTRQPVPAPKEQLQEEVEDSSDSSPSSSSSEDSSDNIQLSTLKETLKAEAASAESEGEAEAEEENKSKATKREPKDEQDQFLDEATAPKRRRRSVSSNCLDVNFSNQSSLASNLSYGTSSGSSVLSLFNTDANDANDPLVSGSAASPRLPISETMDELVHNANNLIELSSSGQAQRSLGVFNDQSAGVEDAISFLRQALPNSANSMEDEAHLDIFSDVSNELPYQVEPHIDVVGESSPGGLEEEDDEEKEADDAATANTSTTTTEDHNDDVEDEDHDDSSTAHEDYI